MMTEKKELEQLGWNLDNSYSRLPKSFYSKLNPIPVRAPKLVFFNNPLAESLGLNVQAMQNKHNVLAFSGNSLVKGSMPLAQAYAAHQFGHFTMLGDGRAVLLGEQITPKGNRFDIQLKGAGRTPYSRGGDGRAALGPMLREYIISEAMYGLGIPTTRSLAVMTTGEPVIREKTEIGAILTRVAASHIRVGTFQYASEFCTFEDLKILADYTIDRHFSNVKSSENPYRSLLDEVIKNQAELIAKWQLVGFIHGVMNTDNMAISGESIDYGPCAFMDKYDPETVFSSIDTRGRYAYGKQPYIAVWNLARLAETLLPLLHDDEANAVKLAEDAISNFKDIYHHNWLSGMRAKLGLFNEEEQDELLIRDLLVAMHKYNSDYTNTFLALTFDKFDDGELFNSTEFINWSQLWKARLSRQQQSKESSHQLMKDNNPAVIPRNHRVEEALEAAVKQGDYTVMERLLKVLANPYEHSLEQEEYSVLPEPSSCGYRTFCGT